MKTVKYVPELCKGESPKLVGSIELALPKYTDKLKFLKSTSINIEAGAAAASSMGNSEKLDFAIKMIEFSEKHYLAVDLTNPVSGATYKSFEDLEYDQDGGAVLQEVASFLVNGSPLGN